MIVIAIIGILAAIALPAYARYMARARFTEVTSAVEGVKKQVELCIFDLGLPAAQAATTIIAQPGCSNAGGAVAGNGWRIGAPADYETKYVATITVGANGVIIAAAQNTNGLGASTFAVAPATGADPTNGIIDWVRSDGNTYNGVVTVDNMNCDNNELC
jgi:Tfp pilus assembly major pilin PilA